MGTRAILVFPILGKSWRQLLLRLYCCGSACAPKSPILSRQTIHHVWKPVIRHPRLRGRGNTSLIGRNAHWGVWALGSAARVTYNIPWTILLELLACVYNRDASLSYRVFETFLTALAAAGVSDTSLSHSTNTASNTSWPRFSPLYHFLLTLILRAPQLGSLSSNIYDIFGSVYYFEFKKSNKSDDLSANFLTKGLECKITI